ncbi:unnamed protein product [Miscanthus lutarioriparius]|uniref:F-box domain-containing protein n=1 Tax=Miscanthus lutarioriparius TaxID=422564 RepID=A0A811RC40_9POAL|nr:unnamed protein product [Miscanthus lutarioriparius]
MQLRSGRRLVYPPPEPQGGGHRRRSQHSSEDRISGLPEDLLLEVLARLRSPAGAARAGAVCRAWRGLWTDLPELWFYSAQPLHVESTLARITRPSLDLLDINLWADWADDEDWNWQVSLLLHGAARVLPDKLIITVSWVPLTNYAVDLPCFERTSYLSLDLMGSLPITLPQYGEFTALKSLYLNSCCIDLGSLLPLCPCLRILNIGNLIVDTVIVHSPSLEEFVLESSNWRSEDVSLANLEVVEIHGLEGKDDEVDFLKIILRCATVLRILTMTISDDISPSNNSYEKIYSIMKEYPDVECHVMASSSEEVLYP